MRHDSRGRDDSPSEHELTGQVLRGEHDIVYELRDVVMVYPGQNERANDGISLDIHRGEIFGILGDNGAGKTTLVRQMVNLLQPTSGSIRLFGRPVEEDPLGVTTRVGFMPQEGAVLDSLTVDELLFVTAHLRGTSRDGARRERDRLIEFWDLTAVRRRPCRHISGGQLRLVQLALATASAPPVVILDEPTANLDPQRRRLVWKNLRQLNRDQGTTVIFITHDAVEAEKIIERVAILRAGRVVAIGVPASLKRGVDRQVRLELETGAEEPPALGTGFRFSRLPTGRWFALVGKDQLSEVLQRLDLERYDDFRIYSCTLEDLYLHYAERAGD